MLSVLEAVETARTEKSLRKSSASRRWKVWLCGREEKVRSSEDDGFTDQLIAEECFVIMNFRLLLWRVCEEVW